MVNVGQATGSMFDGIGHLSISKFVLRGALVVQGAGLRKLHAGRVVAGFGNALTRVSVNPAHFRHRSGGVRKCCREASAVMIDGC